MPDFAYEDMLPTGQDQTAYRLLSPEGVEVVDGPDGTTFLRVSDEAIRQMVPAGRAGTPEEVAALVGFLCSDAAGYINGQVIGINGGMG